MSLYYVIINRWSSFRGLRHGESMTVPIPADATIGEQPESQPQEATTVTTVPIPEGATILNEGEQVNDVGNKVIVPKEGESFADTMKRAAAYGKTVTPEQINAEVRTMPDKAAQTV